MTHINTDDIFKNLGNDMRLIRNGSKTPVFKGVLQPLRYKNKMYLEGTPTPIGLNEENYYLYIGPGKYDISAGFKDATLVCGGIRYGFDRCERFKTAGKTAYIWGIAKTVN
ncbi:MAG: hypothetical protein FWF08_04795 [Oscillospiraceae bacterium]|nr:hypothetical protein [Oscillospiraceae bacterium]